MRAAHTLAVVASLIAVVCTAPTLVHACACCTNEGQRYVGVQKLDSSKRFELDQVRFKTEAQLFTGEADPADAKGIATPSSHYELQVTQQPGRWIFAFRDKDGHNGTLVLALPASMSIFEVDPRQGERPGGPGPVLYKEWTLTAKAAGTGIFAAGVSGNAHISLVLHGHGNSCTDIGHFSHWTLVVSGPKAAYKLFGELGR
jgi:hypothetical protein